MPLGRFPATSKTAMLALPQFHHPLSMTLPPHREQSPGKFVVESLQTEAQARTSWPPRSTCSSRHPPPSSRSPTGWDWSWRGYPREKRLLRGRERRLVMASQASNEPEERWGGLHGPAAVNGRL